MTKKEFQVMHGFSDYEMDFIAQAVKVMNGTIVGVK